MKGSVISLGLIQCSVKAETSNLTGQILSPRTSLDAIGYFQNALLIDIWGEMDRYVYVNVTMNLGNGSFKLRDYVRRLCGEGWRGCIWQSLVNDGPYCWTTRHCCTHNFPSNDQRETTCNFLDLGFGTVVICCELVLSQALDPLGTSRPANELSQFIQRHSSKNFLLRLDGISGPLCDLTEDASSIKTVHSTWLVFTLNFIRLKIEVLRM